MDDEPEENESKEKVGEENVPLVDVIQVPSGRCLVEEERQAGGQKRTEAWIFLDFFVQGKHKLFVFRFLLSNMAGYLDIYVSMYFCTCLLPER